MSEWQTVSDPLAARLLTDPELRRLLGAFRGAGSTVTEAARLLGWGLDAALYRVRQAQRCGLLRVVGERPRRGKAQKVYALALPLFVPGDLIPGGPDTLMHPDEDAFIEKVRRIRARALAGGGWGILLRAGPHGLSLELSRPEHGEASTFDVLRRPEAPAVMDVTTVLHLSFEDAKALQMRLWALYTEYAGRSGEGGTHLLKLTLYPAPS